MTVFNIIHLFGSNHINLLISFHFTIPFAYFLDVLWFGFRKRSSRLASSTKLLLKTWFAKAYSNRKKTLSKVILRTDVEQAYFYRWFYNFLSDTNQGDLKPLYIATNCHWVIWSKIQLYCQIIAWENKNHGKANLLICIHGLIILSRTIK